MLGDEWAIGWRAVAVEFLVPDGQCGGAAVVAPGGEAHAAARAQHASHLSERRLRLGHVEQHERHDDDVVRG